MQTLHSEDKHWIIRTAKGNELHCCRAETMRQAIGKWEEIFRMPWSKRTRGRRIGWRCVRVKGAQ